MPHPAFTTTKTPSATLRMRSRAPHRLWRGPDRPRRSSFPMNLPASRDEWSTYHRPCIQLKMMSEVDAEVGKAHHMHVTRRRQQRSRRFPGPVISTTPQPYPYPWPIPSHVEHGPWLWLGNRWKSWGAKALSPMSESCEANPTSCGQKRT